MPASNTENHSSLVLQVFNRLGKLVSQGNKGDTKIDMKLEPGTSFKAGDLQVDYTDGVNESPKVDVPAFTVPGGSASGSSIGSSSSSSNTGSGSKDNASSSKSTK